MDELEYITKGALVMCDEGGAPAYFHPAFNSKVKIHGCLVATNKDAEPLRNIPSFKVCKITGGTCVPDTLPMTWQDTWQVKVNGVQSLIGKSTCKCSIGGTIEFLSSGQIPLPKDAADEVTALQERSAQELENSKNDSVGEAGFLESMIPIWGSGRDLINAVQTGDTFGVVLNSVFLVWDVGSIVVGALSFGTGTAAMQSAKIGLKAGIKAGARAIKKKALDQLGKLGFKQLNKQALKEGLSQLMVRLCVIACFPEGTPIHTEYGLKNIEELEVGDLVWAYDEETGTVALQPVVDTMVNVSDHTVSIYTDKEVIETTAAHPFYVENTGWVEASELNEGDSIVTKDSEPLMINKVEFNYEPKKVYNFTVGNFHTYFVGILAWLVHNARKCLYKLAREGEEWAQNIIRGIAFNKEMAKRMGSEYVHELWTLGKFSRVDTFLKGGGEVISNKATQLAEITFDTAKKYIDEIGKKYADKTVMNPLRAGTTTLEGKKILQVPKQEKGIPEAVKKYARDADVKIQEVKEVTMKMLEQWNKK